MMITLGLSVILLQFLSSSCTNISPDDLPDGGATIATNNPVRAGLLDQVGSSSHREAQTLDEVVVPSVAVPDDVSRDAFIPSSDESSDLPPLEDSEEMTEVDEESFEEIHTSVIGEGEQEEALLESFSNILKDFEKSLQEGELKRKAESVSKENEAEGQQPKEESVPQTGGGEGEGSLLTSAGRDQSDMQEDDQQEGMSDSSSNSTVKKVVCLPHNNTEVPRVQIVNATTLMNLLLFEPSVKSRSTPATCIMLMFFARWCQFSAQAAPHFNALARAFPDVQMYAIDAMKYHSVNTQYGTMAVPTLLLFHNGRPAAKFNETSYNLETFAAFISKHTNVSPLGLLNVTSTDFTGPVPSRPTQDTDIWLWVAWVFLIWCILHFFVKSAFWERIVETVRNTWREAEAQHEHAD